MQLIGKSKIGKKRSKPSITYPFVRLPKEYTEIIGRPANIYKTEREDCTAFVITLEDEERNRAAGKVAQPDSKVGQPRPLKAADSRLSAIKSQIVELKSLIQSASYTNSETKKGAPESGFEPESEPRQGLFRQ